MRWKCLRWAVEWGRARGAHELPVSGAESILGLLEKGLETGLLVGAVQIRTSSGIFSHKTIELLFQTRTKKGKGCEGGSWQ